MPKSMRKRLLLLTPTQFELDLLRTSGRDYLSRTQITGFGPIASGVRATQLITEHAPHWVVLVGIAGALRSFDTIGQALVFQSVEMEGIGVGCGQRHESAVEVGWSQAESIGLDSRDDMLELALPRQWPGSPAQLLTVCAAASSRSEANTRSARFSQAVAEDMEGWSVALAGAVCGIPVSIVRGISNRAGDRQHERWHIAEAMEAAADMTEQLCQAIEAQMESSAE